MRVVNKLTNPGGIRRVDLTPDIVRIVLSNGTEKIYYNDEPRYRDQADYGCLDALASTREE